VARDAAFVASLHKQLVNEVCSEIQSSILDRLDDWKLEQKLGQLEQIVKEVSKDEAW
jgi:hypothetical protein